MKASHDKPKRQAKNEKKAEPKVRDLVPKKDARGGEEVTFNYGGVKWNYKQ
jgi:hypothetical protein